MPAVETSTPSGRKHRGHWDDFKDAVAAMQPEDLLIWKMTEAEAPTAHSRRTDMHTPEFRTVANWYGGKLYVVRVL